jgi:hypothetical protein
MSWGSERKYDTYRAAALLAHAYANSGQTDLAEAWFLEGNAILNKIGNLVQLCVITPEAGPQCGSKGLGREDSN